MKIIYDHWGPFELIAEDGRDQTWLEKHLFNLRIAASPEDLEYIENHYEINIEGDDDTDLASLFPIIKEGKKKTISNSAAEAIKSIRILSMNK